MLEVIDLFKSYSVKKGPKIIAIDHVNLSFPETGLVFVLGRSGAGKSTFLNLLGGLEKADGGEIRIEGKSSKDFKDADYDAYRNTYLGFVFQEYNLLSEYSVRGNLELALSLQGQQSDPSLIGQALGEVGLAGYEERKVNELSGGQRQRVAIARALIKNPKVILADEPTGALDSESSLEILRLLKHLSQEKLVIVVTHDQGFAKKFGDRIITFKDGKVMSDKNTIETKKSLQNTSELYLRKAHLPLVNSLRMAFSSSVSRPAKLVVSILLTSIAFTLLGVSASAARFDTEASGVKALRFTNSNFALIRKGLATLNGKNGRYSSIQMPIGEEDLKALNARTGLHFEGRRLNHGIPLHTNYPGDADNTYFYYPREAIDLYPSDALPKAFPLVSGRLPAKEGEVCITLRELEGFQHFGYQIFDLSQNKELTTSGKDITAETILGKGLTGNGNTTVIYTIVGVVDTHFDSAPYAKLKAIDDIGEGDANDVDGTLSNALAVRDAASFDCVLFTVRLKESSYQRNNRFYLTAFNAGALLTDEASQRFTTYNCGHELVKDQPFVFAHGKTALTKNEVLVSDFDFAKFLPAEPIALSASLMSKYGDIATEGNRLYGTSSQPSPFGEAPTSVQDLFADFRAYETFIFAKDHLAEAQASHFPFAQYGAPEEKPTSDDDLRAFQSFIWTCCLAPEPTSEVKFIASWRDRFVPFFTQEIETALSDNETALYQGANASLSISTGSDEVKLTNLRVVGFYVPTGDFVGDNFETGSLVISDELAETYLPFRFDYFDSAVAYLPLDEGIEKQMVAAYMQSHDNPTTGVTYSVDSEPLSQVYYAKMTSQGYGTLLLWAGGILLFFAVLLFANLISTSIEAQKKKSASSAPSALARSTSMASMVSNP